jgi:hypothetical protein
MALPGIGRMLDPRHVTRGESLDGQGSGGGVAGQDGSDGAGGLGVIGSLPFTRSPAPLAALIGIVLLLGGSFIRKGSRR